MSLVLFFFRFAGYLDATTLADYLVEKGIPFRSAHEIVGKCVALGIDKQKQLKELSLDDFKEIHETFDSDVYGYLGVTNAVNRFISFGSTGRESVLHQLDEWKQKLNL